MATRTSSPPASRSKSTPAKTSAKKSGTGGSTSRSRPSGTKSGRKPAARSGAPARKGAASRPAPRAVRNGTGPVATVGIAAARVVVSAWLGLAHAVGGGVRRVGHTARDLEPEHRRDGAGLFLVGLAVVVAASVWWQLPGGIGDFTRAAVAGSVGLVAWFVPLMLVYIAWRNMRDPEAQRPRRSPGRRLGGAAVRRPRHRAHRQRLAEARAAATPGRCSRPAAPSASWSPSCSPTCCRRAYVVVPLLALLAVFGLLVVTATPVYQVPARLRELRERIMGRASRRAGGRGRRRGRGQAARQQGPHRRRTSTPTWATRRTTPRCWTSVMEDREVGKRDASATPRSTST